MNILFNNFIFGMYSTNTSETKNSWGASPVMVAQRNLKKHIQTTATVLDSFPSQTTEMITEAWTYSLIQSHHWHGKASHLSFILLLVCMWSSTWQSNLSMEGVISQVHFCERVRCREAQVDLQCVIFTRTVQPVHFITTTHRPGPTNNKTNNKHHGSQTRVDGIFLPVCGATWVTSGLVYQQCKSA